MMRCHASTLVLLWLIATVAAKAPALSPEGKSPSSKNSSSAPGPAPSDDNSNPNQTTYIIAAVGTIVFALEIAGAIWYWCHGCRKRRPRHDVEAPSEKLDTDESYVPPYSPPPRPPRPLPPIPTDSISWSVCLKRTSDSENTAHKEVAGRYAFFTHKGARPGAGWQCLGIDQWISHQFSGKRWNRYVLYNDQPPENVDAYGQKIGNDPSGVGHCKGVLVHNESIIIWLIHSTPRWPAYFDLKTNTPVNEIDDKQCKMGQSYVALSLPYSQQQWSQILHQIYLMEAYVYNTSHENFAPPDLAPYWRVNQKIDKKPGFLNSINFASGIAHVGKNGNWEMCFYRDHLVNLYGPNNRLRWAVQTFGRTKEHKKEEDMHVMDKFSGIIIDVTEKVWPDDKIRGTGSDHSKWAITLPGPNAPPLVCIGDLNREIAQTKRGGGGLVIRDEALWRLLWHMVADNVRLNTSEA